jgi:hypothetical protein
MILQACQVHFHDGDREVELELFKWPTNAVNQAIGAFAEVQRLEREIFGPKSYFNSSDTGTIDSVESDDEDPQSPADGDIEEGAR